MTVQIVYTVEVSGSFRRAINAYHSRGGLASRGQIRDWYMTHGKALDKDLMTDAILLDGER